MLNKFAKADYHRMAIKDSLEYIETLKSRCHVSWDEFSENLDKLVKETNRLKELERELLVGSAPEVAMETTKENINEKQ